ncbi:MAG: radical SAM family heme chaperone HemW [Microthrixaceae bacterium]
MVARLPAVPAGAPAPSGREAVRMDDGAVGAASELRTPWARPDPAEVAATPIGLYVHVPFCERRCGYCAFNTATLADPGGAAALATTERYVAAALAELDLAADVLRGAAPPLTSVFVGGGTPTMLNAAQLVRILDRIRQRFDVADDLEVTVESNPDGLAPGQLAALREEGVTRVSFGMQSVRRRVLALLDRTHDPERSLAAVAEARAAGFDHVSLDLIYGTPGETAEDWRATLDAALSTRVDHVSAYALGIEAGTKLGARVRRGELPRPDDDEAADRYLVADEVLRAAGFDWYEISNWARSPDARCRHNLLYWRNHNWWGIGPGAHSHLSGTRWWNVDPVEQWADALFGRGPDTTNAPGFVGGQEHLDDEQRRLEDLMLGIRLVEGLPLDERSDRRLVLTPRGRLLADTVAARLAAG